jgi:predicted GTPase
MTNKKTITIILSCVLVLCLGTILLINKVDFLSGMEAEAKQLLKQYLRVFGFLSIMAIVYVRFQKKENKEIEE